VEPVDGIATNSERILDKMKLTSNYEIVRCVLQEGLLE
jgi:hypothetical protein